VSVVGYNNDSLAQDLNPPLTTVNIPAYELGREAVRFALSEAAASSGPVTQKRRVLGTHTVLRDSVARPRA
jgi:LacI family transcriptional regulator